jgi:hypothetical protein
MGHHITDQAAVSLGSISVPAQATGSDTPVPIFTSSDRIAVPSVAVELLRSCIQRGKDGKDVTEQLLAVVAPICAEARRAHAMPEHVIVSIKELCRSLPEFDAIRGAYERAEFLERVVKLAIEEYYRA